ncbi:carbohydrate kinase [Gottfriedia acidiceleris]|uniref:carbohydrate kinase family protein n=1 Tax=Bacillaceae TaxID=186817 RepID=UPI000BEC1E8F|nr:MULTISPECIES: carbohydrate kinase [unclassified Bacillus (in: firmicutes)]PEC51370.1 carbohydrate kinase [Bacillus sp. AFS096315]PFM78836.1 carbohydrate kinase [Bacillus sp. AFS077874]
MYDVTALGELLIDLTPYNSSQPGKVVFERNPGGAPANVLAGLTKLGKKTCFIGKVGDDQFGHYLKQVLLDTNICCEGLSFTRKANTTLAFVHLDEYGDRSFSFYRNPGADTKLTEDDINENIVAQTKIFHFGSLSLTNEPAATTTLKTVQLAKEQGKVISYDPNLRALLWKNLEHAKKMIKEGLKYANIVKLSEEELEFITGKADLEKGTRQLVEQYNTELIFVTLGAEGCFYRKGENIGKFKSFKVNPVDTTGAGDGFFSGVLYKYLEKNKPIADLNIDDMQEIIIFGNAVGAIVTTRKGAILSMPCMEEVKKLMDNQN